MDVPVKVVTKKPDDQPPADTPQVCSLMYNKEHERLTLDCRMKRNLHVELDFEHLAIRKVIVNCPCFDARHAEFLRSCSFKELLLNELHNTEWIKANAEKDGEQYKMNTDVLRQVLNQENGQQLQHLTIKAKNLRFEEGWPMNLTSIANNLTSLSIPFMELSNAEFQEMCTYFTGLTYLDISNTKLGSLEGIARLKKLTGLVFHNPNIMRQESISELRELSNLTMLDVSASLGRQSIFAELFAKSGIALPALQNFLCTRNFIRAYNLSQILTRNWKLKNMGLLDIASIDVVHGLRIRYTKVRFLSTETLSQCIDSYTFFKTLSTPTSEEIFSKLVAFLEYNYDEQTNDDFHKCLRFLITELSKNPELSFSSTAVIKGLYFLTCNIKPNIIPVDYKYTIIKSCLHILKSDYALKEAQEYSWMVLKPEFIADSPIDLISEISLQAAIWAGEDENKLMCCRYVEILLNHLDKLPVDKSFHICNDERLKDVLMKQLQGEYYFQNPKDLIPLVTLIARLTRGSVYNSPCKVVITAYRMMIKFCQLRELDVRLDDQLPEVIHQTFLNPVQDTSEVQVNIFYAIVSIMPLVVKPETYRKICYTIFRYSSFVVNAMKIILPQISVTNRRFIPISLCVFIYAHHIGRVSFAQIPVEDLCFFVGDIFAVIDKYTENRHLERYTVLNEQVSLHGETLSENSWILVVNNFFDAWTKERADHRRRENHGL